MVRKLALVNGETIFEDQIRVWLISIFMVSVGEKTSCSTFHFINVLVYYVDFIYENCQFLVFFTDKSVEKRRLYFVPWIMKNIKYEYVYFTTSIASLHLSLFLSLWRPADLWRLISDAIILYVMFKWIFSIEEGGVIFPGRHNCRL